MFPSLVAYPLRPHASLPRLASGRRSIRSAAGVWPIWPALQTKGNGGSNHAPQDGTEQCPEREEHQCIEPCRTVGHLTVEASTQPTQGDTTDHPEDDGDLGDPAVRVTDRPPEEDPPDRQERSEGNTGRRIPAVRCVISAQPYLRAVLVGMIRDGRGRRR